MVIFGGIAGAAIGVGVGMLIWLAVVWVSTQGSPAPSPSDQRQLVASERAVGVLRERILRIRV